MIVCSFLIRLEPFTQHYLKLQVHLQIEQKFSIWLKTRTDRAVHLITLTDCSIPLEKLGSLLRKRIWATSESWFRNSSICQNSSRMSTSLILERNKEPVKQLTLFFCHRGRMAIRIYLSKSIERQASVNLDWEVRNRWLISFSCVGSWERICQPKLASLDRPNIWLQAARSGSYW